MKYTFPEINHISDVLPAIEGSPEFIVAERDGYKVINYNVNMPDTFPPINESQELEFDILAQRNKLRRECRGIMFCSETGEIIRRPYHKFFNVGERDETQPHKIGLHERHSILEKLDGSFIVPFYANDRLIWGTKMGETDVAGPVVKFVNENNEYIKLAEHMLADGFNPIFEWCSRKQRIVIDHPEDRLVLTGIRSLVSGEYFSYDDLFYAGYLYAIPVVKRFDSRTDINSFIEYTRDLQDTEGFVIRFDDGHMLKLKCDWYCQIHKAKEKLLFDRNIVEMILEGNIDDLKPHLLHDDKEKLENFERIVWARILEKSVYINDAVMYYQHDRKADRKTFALEHVSNLQPLFRPIAFRLWDNNTLDNAKMYLIDTIKSNLGSNSKYENIKYTILNGEKFNEF